MAQLLLIDDDPGSLFGFETILRTAGYGVVTASSGAQAFDVLRQRNIDLVAADLRLPDMSGLEILRHLRDGQRPIPFVVITGFGTARDAVTALRLGAADFLEKPVFEDALLHTVRASLGTIGQDGPAARPGAERAPTLEAHAAARWARVLVPIVDAPKDPRTISGWSRVAYASPGALRNWCRMAGISPRRSLVFGRLLRAVFLGRGGKHKPENLLDVVDRRTLVGLLRLAGLNPQHDFPSDVDAFLQRQALIRDPDTLQEIKRALEARQSHDLPDPVSLE